MDVTPEQKAVEEQYAAVIQLAFMELVTGLTLAEALPPLGTVQDAEAKFGRALKLARKAKLLALDVLRGKTA